MTSWFVPATRSIDENAPDELPVVIATATGGHFEPVKYMLDAARQVTIAKAGEPGGMEPMEGV